MHSNFQILKLKVRKCVLLSFPLVTKKTLSLNQGCVKKLLQNPSFLANLYPLSTLQDYVPRQTLRPAGVDNTRSKSLFMIISALCFVEKVFLHHSSEKRGLFSMKSFKFAIFHVFKETYVVCYFILNFMQHYLVYVEIDLGIHKGKSKVSQN